MTKDLIRNNKLDTNGLVERETEVSIATLGGGANSLFDVGWLFSKRGLFFRSLQAARRPMNYRDNRLQQRGGIVDDK